MTTQTGLDLLIDCLRTEVAGLPQSVNDATPGQVHEAVNISIRNKLLSQTSRRLLAGDQIVAHLQQKAGLMSSNSAMLAELCAVSAELSQASVPYVFIKGPLQQREIYGNAFVRSATDIDILVRKRDFALIERKLISIGYDLATPSFWWRGFLGEEHFIKISPARSAIDLHHSIHQPGTPGPDDTESFIRNAVEVTLNGVQIPTLSSDSTRLLCAISIAKALYNREPCGAYICDLFVSLMAGAPDTVNSFLTRAKRCGLGGHARVALRLIREIFGPDFGHDLDLGGVLSSLSGRELLGFALTPETTELPIPKRRLLMWEYCGRDHLRYGRELARVAASEMARRMFEDSRKS